MNLCGVVRRSMGALSALACALAAALALSPAAARAEIWGYVDERGVAHLAAEKLDERYALFSRGAPVYAVGSTRTTPDPAPEVAIPDTTPALPPPLARFFATSAGYRQAQPLLRDASRQHGIDYELLKALIVAESGFDAQAVSPKGAIGLMQVMPATAERWGVRGDRTLPIERKLADPQVNVRTGTRYLRHLIDLFPGQLDLALAAYNAGEGAVQRAGNRIPPFRETQNYVRTVMQLYALLKPPQAARPAAVVAASTPRRVRMELPGQVPGRASMPPSLTLPSPALTDGPHRPD